MAIDPSVAPTIEDLEFARATLERNEPRAFFYKVATELVDLALRSATNLSIAEAMAVLLQTWNSDYFQYRPFDRQHCADIERVVATYRTQILAFRPRTLDSLVPADSPQIHELFGAFEQLLGPDSAAKCLHLLAPLFFPLWDVTIAKEYNLRFLLASANAARYCKFMEITKGQWLRLGGPQGIGRNPLRAIDEYNYCKCARKWL